MIQAYSGFFLFSSLLRFGKQLLNIARILSYIETYTAEHNKYLVFLVFIVGNHAEGKMCSVHVFSAQLVNSVILFVYSLLTFCFVPF